MTLWLASKSPARREMLAAAGLAFETVSAPLDEEAVKADVMASGADAAALALRLAEAKALSVAAPADTLVIGADQVLGTENGGILSKAGSRVEMRDQLQALRGRPHKLHSAAAVTESGQVIWSGAESATLAMRDFSDSFLDDYLDAEYEEARGNVGGYRIEGPGVQLFEKVDGSHFAILGLPLLPLLAFLRTRGIVAR